MTTEKENARQQRINEATGKLAQMVDKTFDLMTELHTLKVSLYQLRNELDPSRSMAYKGWTRHDDDELVKDCEKGIPIKDIAARFGRGDDAVKNRLHQLGVRGHWKLP